MPNSGTVDLLKVSPETIEAIRQKLASGERLEEISQAIGWPKSRIYRLAKQLKMKRRKRSMSTRKKNQMDQLIRDGNETLSDIARKLKLHKSTVCRRRKQLQKVLPGHRPSIGCQIDSRLLNQNSPET